LSLVYITTPNGKDGLGVGRRGYKWQISSVFSTPTAYRIYFVLENTDLFFLFFLTTCTHSSCCFYLAYFMHFVFLFVFFFQNLGFFFFFFLS
jgi:hypothetical protein